MAPGSREGRAEAENNCTEQGNVPVLHGIMDTKNETELRDISRTPLVVQWLRLHIPDARGLGSFLVRELDPTCCKEDPTKPKKYFFLKKERHFKESISKCGKWLYLWLRSREEAPKNSRELYSLENQTSSGSGHRLHTAPFQYLNVLQYLNGSSAWRFELSSLGICTQTTVNMFPWRYIHNIV